MSNENRTRTEVIFDSRNAKAAYQNFDYYRSTSFTVPGGYMAVVELTALQDALMCLSMTAVRIPIGFSDDCYEINGIGKRYRRWRCSQALGNTKKGTDFSPYNGSVVRWGNDHINKQPVEFEYIVRPGRYYLIGDKCENLPVEECDRPVIIEVTLVPVSCIPDLALPCAESPVHD